MRRNALRLLTPYKCALRALTISFKDMGFKTNGIIKSHGDIKPNNRDEYEIPGRNHFQKESNLKYR